MNHSKNTAPHHHQDMRAAFTLTELLITIFLIAALSALLFPLVRNGIGAAKQSNTVNQLRQVGGLTVTYAMDNNNILPDEGGEGLQAFSRLRNFPNAWYNVLPPMVSMKPGSDYRSKPLSFYQKDSMFFVPAAKYPKRKTTSAYFAYGINSQLVTADRPQPRLTDIPHPSRTALYAEAALPDETKLLPTGGATDSLGQPKVRDKRFVGRHKKSGVITFADGHARVVPVDKANASSQPAVFWEIPEPTP